MAKGELFIISGPSGTGKGTVCDELVRRGDVFLSVSATTRNIRAGEQEGVTYYYTTKEQFAEMVENGTMLEAATYGGHYYGTPKAAVEKMLDEGKNVILEIDAQGALLVKEKMPDSILIFIIPPTIKELRKRLISRGREDDSEIVKRIERAEWELSQSPEYDYVLVNDDLETCVNDTLNIIKTENEQQRAREIVEELRNELKGGNYYDD